MSYLSEFDISKKIVTLKDRISFLLQIYPETANNYLYLLAYYWKIFDKIPLSNEVIISLAANATPPETISRIKRMLLSEDARSTNNDLLAEIRNFRGEDC